MSEPRNERYTGTVTVQGLHKAMRRARRRYYLRHPISWFRRNQTIMVTFK